MKFQSAKADVQARAKVPETSCEHAWYYTNYYYYYYSYSYAYTPIRL